MDFEITKVPESTPAQLQEPGLALVPVKEPQQEESLLGTIGRGIARTGARAVETIVGLPGDVSEGILGLVGAGEKALFGTEVTPKKIDFSLGLLKKMNEGIESLTGIKPHFPDTFSLPTSEDVKKYVTKPLGREAIEPQAKWEKVADSIIEDTIPLLIPGVKGKIPFAKALKVSGISNIASWLSGELGAGEAGQAATKLGTTLLTTVASPGILKKYAKTLRPTQAANFLDEVKESSKILKFVGKFKPKVLTPGTSILIGSYFGKGIPSAIGIAGIYGTAAIEKTLRAFSKHPELRKHYKGILKAAVNQNGALVAKNIKKLDNALNKLPTEDSSLATGDFEITKI